VTVAGCNERAAAPKLLLLLPLLLHHAPTPSTANPYHNRAATLDRALHSRSAMHSWHARARGGGVHPRPFDYLS
jgi:hypothetical protein